MSGELSTTPLHAWHVAHRGKMVDFAGWSMPVHYGSIVEEHQACRTSAALFDVSHMGRLSFYGSAAATFLDRMLTRKVLDIATGKVRYALVCNESGGILDDVLVYHFPQESAGFSHLMVVNASNRAKIVSWLNKHISPSVDLRDGTPETAMIAIQGPRALELLAPLVKVPLKSLTNYSATLATIGQANGIVSRTGYTGEDGCEIIVPAEAAEAIWSQLIDRGAVAAGLGARDTLRLEAAMPLYGHELNENIDPLQAGLGFAVNMAGRDFVGRAAIEQRSHASSPQRMGLRCAGRRVPREHYGVFQGDQQVGEITSGTFSPTLQVPIAMAYVEPTIASVGTALTIDIRGSREACEVVPLPFYKRRG